MKNSEREWAIEERVGLRTLDPASTEFLDREGLLLSRASERCVVPWMAWRVSLRSDGHEFVVGQGETPEGAVASARRRLSYWRNMGTDWKGGLS